MEKWMVAAKRADFKGIGERFGIDQVTARIIRNRDVIGEKAIEKYLHGSRKDFYSPWLLKDMEKAVAILQEKIENRNRYFSAYSVQRNVNATVQSLRKSPGFLRTLSLTL